MIFLSRGSKLWKIFNFKFVALLKSSLSFSEWICNLYFYFISQFTLSIIVFKNSISTIAFILDKLRSICCWWDCARRWWIVPTTPNIRRASGRSFWCREYRWNYRDWCPVEDWKYPASDKWFDDWLAFCHFQHSPNSFWSLWFGCWGP